MTKPFEVHHRCSNQHIHAYIQIHVPYVIVCPTKHAGGTQIACMVSLEESLNNTRKDGEKKTKTCLLQLPCLLATRLPCLPWLFGRSSHPRARSAPVSGVNLEPEGPFKRLEAMESLATIHEQHEHLLCFRCSCGSALAILRLQSETATS